MIAALAPIVDTALHLRTMASTPPTSRTVLLRRWAKRLALLLVLLLAAALVARFALDKPRPSGTPGPAADALAHRMERAVARDRWDATGAVAWTFRANHHLWDRQRDFVEVRREDLRVLLRTEDQSGVAFRGDKALHGAVLREALDDAWKYFCNDSFWLNPIVKVFDPGTTRSIVRVDGRDALLVEYSSGGVTPGDAYLWILGADDLPVEWRMWVSVLPMGGVATPWGGYITLATGAKVATEHGPSGVHLQDVSGAATLSELRPGADPFAALVR